MTVIRKLREKEDQYLMLCNMALFSTRARGWNLSLKGVACSQREHKRILLVDVAIVVWYSIFEILLYLYTDEGKKDGMFTRVTGLCTNIFIQIHTNVERDTKTNT